MEDLKVTRDVIVDLLPAYQSGEASQDTQQLVREFLTKDPEFSRLVAKMEQVRVNGSKAVPSPEVRLNSLNRTKQLIKHQTATLAVAIFCSLAPFAFTFEGSGITWLLIRDAPIAGFTYLFAALVMWIAYAVMRRKLKVF
jgi:anti-sigma factor RsiW